MVDGQPGGVVDRQPGGVVDRQPGGVVNGQPHNKSSITKASKEERADDDGVAGARKKLSEEGSSRQQPSPTTPSGSSATSADNPELFGKAVPLNDGLAKLVRVGKSWSLVWACPKSGDVKKLTGQFVSSLLPDVDAKERALWARDTINAALARGMDGDLVGWVSKLSTSFAKWRIDHYARQAASDAGSKPFRTDWGGANNC